MEASFLLLLVGIVIILCSQQAHCWEESDRVTSLPGQPPVAFKHYAGYVKLREAEEKALFYWFFEADGGVSHKPLVLWLNGGPGCSSIAYGAAQELGPFLVRNRSHLHLNEFAWNKVANLLFLEAPVGVGFSYTNNSKDLEKLGDKITAEDSYTFLINWFKKFPEFKSHDFYITGESYAGHYVPQLSELIYKRNRRTKKDTYINFKGFMIGNAVINDETDQTGMIDYAWSHAIISDGLHKELSKECNFKTDSQSSLCSSAVKTFLQAYSDIDMYSIYTPVCLSDSDNASSSSRLNLVAAPRTFSQHDLWHKLPAGYDPCTENYVEKYFNRKDVQKALHANVTNISYSYAACRTMIKCHIYYEYCRLAVGNIRERSTAGISCLAFTNDDNASALLQKLDVIKKWNDSPDTVLPTITKLVNAGLRVWIYSGDTDGRVPVTSTRYSMKELDMKVKREWRAWFNKEQVAGWVEEYEGGLTMATIRGAGHQVPVFAPEQSLSLLSHFLSAKTLPASRSL